MELNNIRGLLGAGSPGDSPIETPITGVAYRSDMVHPGDAFFCIPGFDHDGHDFALDAVSRGAAVLVVERHLPDISIPQVVVGSSRGALAVVSDAFFNKPSTRLDLIGVTGTNGKTTTTYLCDAILRHTGRVTGLIGTVETRVGGTRIESKRTTPESSDLQQLLARMVESDVVAATMEVSSHAIDLHRVDAVHFAVAAFTNLTQDHLDYHHTIEEYFAVKKRLFTDLDVDARVINVDDPLGAGMAAELDHVLTVGVRERADLRATNVTLSASGSRFRLVTGSGAVDVVVPLVAGYNVANAIVAAGCAYALGIDLDQIAAGLREAPQVPGRLERVEQGQPFAVFVDYAHTPDSLEKALMAVREIVEGRVIVVFGAGGDRDPDKRSLMGAAVGVAADHAVVTSDNPRSEDPVGIILQIEDGLRDSSVSYEIEVDRRAAIACALAQADAGDAVVIAGKGHEDYQIFSDHTIHFDDREVVREELRRLC